MKKYILILLLSVPFVEAAKKYRLGWAKHDAREEMKSYLEKVSVCEDNIDVLEKELQLLLPKDEQYAAVRSNLLREQKNRQFIEAQHEEWCAYHERIKFRHS